MNKRNKIDVHKYLIQIIKTKYCELYTYLRQDTYSGKKDHFR